MVAQIVEGPTPGGEQHASSAASPSVTAPAAPTVAPHEQGAPQGLRLRLPRPTRSKPQQRRTRVTVRRVGPLSVLKFSLIFYSCVMLAIFLGLVFLFMIMQAVGAIDATEEFLTKFLVTNDGSTFQIQAGYLLPRLFLVGCLMVVVWSFINLLVAFLYNLISDVVGGVEITLAEKK
jgi:Transmembrane domain of unknown function (DUF3566)